MAAPPPPPGNPNLASLGPTLHRRSRKHRSPPHPRPREPPEAKRNRALAGGSTGLLLFAALNCSREEKRKRREEVTVGYLHN